MAQPTTFSFGKAVFQLGDGEASETFVAPCGITSGSMSIAKDTNSTVVPDCDDPDAAAWQETDVTSMSWEMSLDGVLAKEALAAIESATFSGIARNIKLRIVGAGTGVGTPDRLYTGTGHLRHDTSWQRGERIGIKISVTGSGALTKADVAALP